LTIFLDVPWCETWYVNLFSFIFGKMKVLEWPMSRSLINGRFELVPWIPCCKHDIWIYLDLYLVKWMYWIDDPCRENVILVYLPTTLINGKFELVPWCETWYVNLFGFKFSKMTSLKWPLSRSLINKKFELLAWRPLLQTWYVNLFSFVFGKMKVLDRPLSRKWDFGLYAYKFDK